MTDTHTKIIDQTFGFFICAIATALFVSPVAAMLSSGLRGLF